MEEQKQNLEDSFQDLFKASVSGSGEDELLRIAADFSMQLSAAQVRCLCYLHDKAIALREKKKEIIAERLEKFVENYLRYKRNNNSANFVMQALGAISLKKFINENTVKINLMKQ